MTHLLTVVIAALQSAAASANTDMLGFNCRFLHCCSVFLLCSLSLQRLLFSSTAMFTALVTAAAQSSLADSHTHRRFDLTLMAD